MLFLHAGIAAAATWDVPADFATIDAAAAAAGSGDTVRIAVGTYSESVDVVGKALVFEGDGAVTWHPGSTRSLHCTGAAACTVRNIAFDGQGSDRAILVDGDSDLVAEGCTFHSGAQQHGGAIHVQNAGHLSVFDSTFENNHANGQGGAIRMVNSGDLVIERSTFRNGSAGTDGGAVRVLQSGSSDIVAVWFEGNDAGDDGGALAVSGFGAGATSVTGSFFCGNTAADEGGGAVLRDRLTTMQGNVFLSNSASSEGGGAYCSGSTLSTENNSFVDNDAADTGAALFSTCVHVGVNDMLTFHSGSVAHGDVLGATDYSLFWANADGDTNAPTQTNAVLADPLMVASPPTVCDPAQVAPLAGSPLIDGGDPALSDVDGTQSDVGAYGGAVPFTTAGSTPPDADGDGFSATDGDCDDGDAAVYPGAKEVPADQLDSDCDGYELCYADADADGFGESVLVLSLDLLCIGPGEAPLANDLCPDFDDAIDGDGDLLPDACDDCPVDNPNDTDNDGVCEGVDVCPGLDDNLDLDYSGVPDCLEGVTTMGGIPGDVDGDGVPDSIDESPRSNGADGQVASPKPPYGCGCASGGSAPALGAWLAVGLMLVRRRRSLSSRSGRLPMNVRLPSFTPRLRRIA